MHPSDKTARIAGTLYVLMGAPAVFSLMYVPNRLVVPGNAGATAGNVTGFETLFRWGMAAELAAAVFLLLLSLALHRLLSHVDVNQARLMVGMVLVSVAISFANVLNSLAALTLFRGTDYLAALDIPQREALGMLFLALHRQGIGIVGIFWGLWLFPLGVLVMRSGFLPRLFGFLLILNCAGYVVASLTMLLSPTYASLVSRVVMPTLLGELWIMLWLLVRGARLPSGAPDKGLSRYAP